MAREGKTVADLQQILVEEKKALQELTRKRKALAADLGELADALTQMKGSARKKAPARPAARKKVRGKARRKRGGKSLRQAVSEILTASGKAMRANEIAEQLPKTGYKTTSSNPKNMISAMLAQSGYFKRLRKGLYALKATKKAPAAKSS